MQFLIDVGRSQIPNFTCALISSIWDVLFYQWVIQAVFSAWLGGAGIGNQGKFLLLPHRKHEVLVLRTFPKIQDSLT